MIKNADAVIAFNGRFGTLSECTISIEESIPTGIIESSGGIADEMRYLCKQVSRDINQESIVIQRNYKKVIDTLIKNVNQT